MSRIASIFCSCLIAVSALVPAASQAAIDLKSAGDFVLLASTKIENTGPSYIQNGNVGLAPGFLMTGFPPGLINGQFYSSGPEVVAAQADLGNAYHAAQSLTPSLDLSGQNLGGMVLLPGVYSFASVADLSGTLVLDGKGDPYAQFIFQIAAALTTASGSAVSVINNGVLPGSNVFWQIGSFASLGSGTVFSGNIMADESITLGQSASIIHGSALSLNGALLLNGNDITKGVSLTSPVPEPESLLLFLSGSMLVFYRKCRPTLKPTNFRRMA